jgi:hypothetical protein
MVTRSVCRTTFILSEIAFRVRRGQPGLPMKRVTQRKCSEQMGTGNWSLLRLTGAMPHGPFQPTLMGLSRVTAGYESYCGNGPVQGHIAQAGLPDLTYPLHDRDVLVTACGRICMHRKRINISTVLAGQRLGIKEVDEGIWLVSFMSYDLSVSSTWIRKLCSPSTPVRPEVVTHVLGTKCHPCVRAGQKVIWLPE